MGRESSIDQLIEEDKKWLDKKLMDKGFCGYEEIARILAERGYNISKSSVHRYGQKLENKLAAIQASTQAAMLFQEHIKDDGDGLGSVVLSMIQSEYFNCFVALQELGEDIKPEKRLEILAKVSKGVAEISKASVNQKKWELEIRRRVREELLQEQAERLEQISTEQGMDAEQVRFWREEFLGVR